jgi:hypothetical protein
MDDRVKKLKKDRTSKEFVFKDRHIRYNWQNSPKSEGDLDKRYVRYHFVIVDDRFIENKLEGIISNFHKKSIIDFPFDEVRKIKGKFNDTGLEYLFVSYDTEYTPNFLSFEGVSTNIKQDKNLTERKVLKIEDYVDRLYG